MKRHLEVKVEKKRCSFGCSVDVLTNNKVGDVVNLQYGRRVGSDVLATMMYTKHSDEEKFIRTWEEVVFGLVIEDVKVWSVFRSVAGWRW